MKASAPVRPHKVSSGCSQLSLRYLTEPSRCKMEEEDLFCLQYDMNDCYSRLKRLVPTIPQDKKVSKVEILQHVIDYILDLQLALETHPALLKQTSPPASTRTPLTQINTEQVSRTFTFKTVLIMAVHSSLITHGSDNSVFLFLTAPNPHK
ncbi:DNA-binding protein inhibitor ID-4 [Anabarilius grahami]|uniref:DNA-binding protein inhibitor ID-4 n=1 Tax=Anabarilius grahami TaxID=495550 RepID=A0A3N0YS43_ANAGA|nr:DNA-binding protein inhibitor ID-4 [Anabarilius grahami]